MIGGRFIWWGYRAPEAERLLFPVVRKHYPLRHWSWSGIFPLEGGFIPDPHYYWSEPMALPDSASAMLGNKSSEFQLVDVNPAFNDYSSEVLLLVRTGDTSAQFQLALPKRQGIQAVLATPYLPSARVFPYEKSVAILVNLFGDGPGIKGFYLLSPPLHSETTIKFVPINTSEFQTIAARLRIAAGDPTVKYHFCETRRKDFRAFFEKYAAPCELPAKNQDEIEANFAEFWR